MLIYAANARSAASIPPGCAGDSSRACYPCCALRYPESPRTRTADVRQDGTIVTDRSDAAERPTAGPTPPICWSASPSSSPTPPGHARPFRFAVRHGLWLPSFLRDTPAWGAAFAAAHAQGDGTPGESDDHALSACRQGPVGRHHPSRRPEHHGEGEGGKNPAGDRHAAQLSQKAAEDVDPFRGHFTHYIIACRCAPHARPRVCEHLQRWVDWCISHVAHTRSRLPFRIARRGNCVLARYHPGEATVGTSISVVRFPPSATRQG